MIISGPGARVAQKDSLGRLLFPGLRVLVADDDHAFRSMLCRQFQVRGARCFPCGSGEEALSIARRVKPDIAILDAVFDSGRSGLEICRVLKRGAVTAGVPVLMISGRLKTGLDREQALKAGAGAYLYKPFVGHELEEAVSGLIGARRLEIENPLRGRIALLDDDADWLSLVGMWLREAGHEVFATRDEERLLSLAAEKGVDCIVLDFELSRGTADELCRRIRAGAPLRGVEIIVHTAHDERRLASLGVGADHFVVKTHDPRELLTTIHVCLRRSRLDSGQIVRGDLRLDPGQGSVTWNDAPVPRLSDPQFRLLYSLVDASPHPRTRRELAFLLFGKELENSARALDKVLGRMKRRLPAELAARIANVRGVGWLYRVPS